HEKSRRLDRMRQHPRPYRLGTNAAARYESCSRLVNRVQAKLPHPIKAAQVPHIQYERTIGLDDCHGPAWASTEGDFVASLNLLKFRKDAGRARSIEIPEETVEPVVTVQPATLIADLHEPRPDMLRSRVDDDGHRARIRLAGEQAVARHDPCEIGRRRSPTVHPAANRNPIQDRERENHGECGNHEILLLPALTRPLDQRDGS